MPGRTIITRRQGTMKLIRIITPFTIVGIAMMLHSMKNCILYGVVDNKGGNMLIATQSFIFVLVGIAFIAVDRVAVPYFNHSHLKVWLLELLLLGILIAIVYFNSPHSAR
jgi:hypothetical protein